MALITAAQFREHYPQLTGTAEDATLDKFIARADALMATWCGFPANDAGGTTLASATYTQYYDGPTRRDAKVLCLCVSPLVSVTSVHVDADRAYGASTLLTEGTDFDTDLPRGALALLPDSTTTRWPVAWRATKVVFVGGYATTPDDLIAITAAEVRHLWDLRRTQGQDAVVDFGQSTTLRDLDALIPAAVRSALETYKVCRA